MGRSPGGMLALAVALLLLPALLGTGVAGELSWTNDDEQDVRRLCHKECNSSTMTQRNDDNVNILCNDSCKEEKCVEGCDLWTEAIQGQNNNCQDLCNGTIHHIRDTPSIYCMIGCHYALNVYVKKMKDAIGVPSCPALVAGSQTNVSVMLRWEGSSNPNITYLVQWKYEAIHGEWEYFQPQSPLRKTECRVTGLHPFTKYKFRIAWIILSEHDPLTSEESMVISTVAYGVPTSAPTISLSAISPNRIQVSWDAPFFSNGPVLSYAVSLKDLSTGHSLVKDISNLNTEKNFYRFNNLKPNTSYRVAVLARNPMGEGPSHSKEIKTPARGQVLKNDSNPYLILGANQTVIKQGIDLFDEPEVIYQSENASDLIRGVSLHIKLKRIFVSDSVGCVYSVPLDGERKPTLLLKPSTLNKHPSTLSVDWLHNKLYLVDGKRIARCDLDGSNYENVIVGLSSEPTEMKVDPYNGFLFWVLMTHKKGHLYKVDLIDLNDEPVSADETKLIFSEEYLMAFAVDYSSLQLLLPSVNKSTVLAISLDGLEVIDIRQNTQQPKFNNIKSFVVHHGLLFWTTGQEVIREEYHPKANKYFHNSYAILKVQKPFVGVNVLHPDAQPYPVPLNPVRHLEAIFDFNQCKISWKTPKLLRGIGTGAWQKWNYELYISNDRNQKIVHIRNITKPSYTAENLKESGVLYIKVRAYSEGGKGPWSEEFKGQTLKTGTKERSPFMLWSSREGILKSNMLATEVVSFINHQELNRSHIIDIAWHEDLLFFNTNSTLILTCNITARQSPMQIESINSAHSVAIDSYAKKIYWSNPYQQVISRSDFDGSQQEPLPIPTVAKELNVDSASAYLYWTTMYSVECARLNGSQRQVYFQAGFFAGKQVLGLTLDRDHKDVYWMVRSQEGAQLFRASMAGYRDVNLKDTVKEIAIMQEDIIRGPLRYYSDRLFWLHDQREALITDLNGKNVATLKGPGLSNLETLTIVDTHLHRYPEGLNKQTLNVRPNQVSKTSIIVQGTWENFNITWNRSENVNYGKVFYEIKIDSDYDRTSVITEDNYYAYNNGYQPLPPYTNITIALRVFTYWSSSRTIIKTIHSPMSVPSEPLHPRVFVSHDKDRLTSTTTNIIAHLRWSPPEQANGVILGYYIACWVNSPIVDTNCNITMIQPTKLEYTIKNLYTDTIYSFQVTAFTEIGMGQGSRIVKATTSEESPVPRLLLTKLDAVEVADMDTQEEQLITVDATEPVDVSFLSQDDLVFWIDQKQGLMKSNINGSNKSQILSTHSAASITVDWIGRFLYWAEPNKLTGKSSIWKIDLNYDSEPMKLFETDGVIRTLRVNPFSSHFIWTIQNNNKTGLMKTSTTDGISTQVLFDRLAYSLPRNKRMSNNQKMCTCPQEINVGKPFTLDVSNPENQNILWVDQIEGHIWSSDMDGCQCKIVVNSSLVDNNGLPPTSITVDKTRIYWSNASLQSVYSMGKSNSQGLPKDMANLIESQVVHGVNIINAIGKSVQPLPDITCLIPPNYEMPPTLESKSSSSLSLRLPPVHFPSHCKGISKPSVFYLIFYRLFDEEIINSCSIEFSNCQFVKTYKSYVTIPNLLPYRNYSIQVAIGNFYNSKHSNLTSDVIFMTSEGAPTKPSNVTIQVVSPEEMLVSWIPPEHLNGPYIHYYFYWEMLNSVTGHQRQGEQTIIPNIEPKKRLQAVLQKLLPEHAYYIMVRAYSSKMNTFSESDKILATTFPSPGNLSENEVTPNSIVITWNPESNNKAIDYKLECKEIISNNMIISSQEIIRNSSLHTFTFTDLNPKTKYLCHVFLTYCFHSEYCNYTWPKDNRFTFETLGDKPGEPGIPYVSYPKKDVYQVTWNPSEGNGGKQLHYILQARPVYSDAEDQSKWTIMHNGTQWNWLISGLDLKKEYVFRVMAVNEYGTSNYSQPSNAFNFAEFGHGEEETSIILGASISIIMVLVVVTLSVLYRVCKQREKDKLDLQDVIRATTNPAMELTTLQELPRNGNFRHQINILYTIGNNLLDEELAALPHIGKDQIVLTNFLGSGAFGEVFEGFARDLPGTTDGDLKVAIKTLRKGATDQEKGEFLKEAQLMSNFKHEHILSLLGVCLDNDPNFIILELMEGGDLLSYLRNNRSNVIDAVPLTVQDLISICVDVAKGCKYLEEMHFVHRDLAARNCLVSSQNPAVRVVKIGDFGLARDIYKNDYYRKEGEGLLPVRWMSPESLMDGVFTTQSDIWAFGVLLWEVMTLGQQPYPARTNLEVLHYVRAGGRLDKPDNCPNDLHQLMLLCWNYNPDQRPTFTYCLDQLQELKRKSADLPHCIHNNHYIGRTAAGLSQSDRSSLSKDKDSGLSSPDTSLQIQGAESSENAKTSLCTANSSLARSQDIPKYLELLCDDQSFCSLTSDGYEIPIMSSSDKKIPRHSSLSRPIECENHLVNCVENENEVTEPTTEPITDESKFLALESKFDVASGKRRPCSCPPQPESDDSTSKNPFHSMSMETHSNSCDACSEHDNEPFCKQPNFTIAPFGMQNVPKTSWC